jgi:Sap, sulfolipid-1-addressing protein
MWTYVVCLGIGMLIDPMRIGISAVLMSRRQAIRTLLAFWIGGMVAGITVGIAVLVLLHDVALGAIQTAVSAINDVRSAVTILAGGHLHITLGVLSLVALAIVMTRERAGVATPAPVPVGAGGGDDPSDVAVQPAKVTLSSRLSAATHRMLESGFVWPAFVVGLMSTFPPVEGPMALTVIMGSRAAAGTQFTAFIVFILLVLVFVEVPLVSYVAAPHRTQAAMLQMNCWITSHRRQIFKTLLAVTGIVLLVQGMVSL